MVNVPRSYAAHYTPNLFSKNGKDQTARTNNAEVGRKGSAPVRRPLEIKA